MPSLDNETVEMRTITAIGEPPGQDFTVEVSYVTWINPPPAPRPEQIDTPEKAAIIEAVRPILENHGLALVACRVEERGAGYVIVTVPAVRGTTRIAVKPENLARPYQPRGPKP